MRVSRRWRSARDGGQGEVGSATIEFLGWLPWVLGVALVAWQLLLYVGAASNAEEASRVGARAAAQGDDGAAVALAVVPDWLTEHTTVVRDRSCDHPSGEGAHIGVSIQVPLIAPWLSTDLLQVERDAQMPC